MTSIHKLPVCLGIVISFLSLNIYAQSAKPELNHFAANEISFDYPAGYSVTDESTTEAHQLLLTRRGSSVQITIVVSRNLVLRDELPAAIENFAEPLVEKVGKKLGEGKNAPTRTAIKSQVGPKEAEGVRLRSSSKGKTTGEVIWLRSSLRLVGLTFVRSDADDSAGAQLWQTVRSSLRVEAPVIGRMKTGEEPEGGAITGGVLNGKALALPQPAYPPLARAAGVSGTVTVQVLIDEQGNVSSAHAVDGHPLLQAVCVAAAQQAKFSPTLLEGEPVKVTGVIKYSFVPR